MQKSLEGDDAVDRAVDVYASDRDVGKFLETLRKLTRQSDSVASAKYDLLRHSLDMMVREGQISRQGNSVLYIVDIFYDVIFYRSGFNFRKEYGRGCWS
jgi:hypothetical protein